MAEKSGGGKGNSKANSRRSRAKANKRRRYRVWAYNAYGRGEDVGRKLKRLGKAGTLSFQ